MHFFKFLTLSIASLTSLQAFAVPTCDLGLSVNNVSLVWSASGLPIQQLSLTVTKSKEQDCNYFVTFSRGASSGDYNRTMRSGGSSLNYQIYKNSSLTNVLKEIPDATSENQVLSGYFGKGKSQSQVQNYYLNIPFADATTPTLKPAGSYTDDLVLKAYEGQLGDTNDRGSVVTASLHLTTIIQKNLQLSLVNSGGSFDPNRTSQSLDFGILSSGAQRGFDLKVLSNAGYSITFSSQNNGVMVHSVSSVGSTVPYTLRVNSSAQYLSSSRSVPVVVAQGSGQTRQDGVANPVTITIDSVTDKMAGNYSDYITVTATTTE